MNHWAHPAYLIREEPTALFEEILGKKGKNHPDFILIQPDGESIRVEAIHQVQRRILYKPLEAERLVVFIEEAHKMTEAAANALLKTLEEPPPYLLFLLRTEIPDQLPLTIRSRCQRVSSIRSVWSVPEEWEAFSRFWKEECLKSKTPVSFSQASQLAEKFLDEFETPKEFLPFLKSWWRDLIIQRGAGEKLFEKWDLILETERAVEANVLKQLAFERLFYGILSP
ncbi:MAG: hypothetical protein HYT76_03000 [Deltaproteobacteria bacterium]|nr:hypothetical protein [Deltaproteobacteria bacterium]